MTKRKTSVKSKSHDGPAKRVRTTRSGKENVPPPASDPSEQQHSGNRGGSVAGTKFVPPARVVVSNNSTQSGGISSIEEGGPSETHVIPNRKEKKQFLPPATTNDLSSFPGCSTSTQHTAGGISSIKEGGPSEAHVIPNSKEKKQFLPPARTNDLSSFPGCSTSTQHRAGGISSIEEGGPSEAHVIPNSKEKKHFLPPARTNDLSSFPGCSTSTQHRAVNRSSFFRPTYEIDTSEDSEGGSDPPYVPLPEISDDSSSSDEFVRKDTGDRGNIDHEDETEQHEKEGDTGHGENEKGEESETGSGVSGNQRQSRSRMRNQDIAKPSRVKRRIRQPISASRQERKEARNSGEAYETIKGKHVPAKAPAALPKCKRGCASIVSPETASHLCDGLWKGLADHDRRASFVASLIDINPKASQQLNSTPPKGRKPKTYSYKYHLSVNGERTQVCKACFLKVFNISAKFIEVAMKKKLSNAAGIISKDSRGKTSSSSVSEGQRQEVREHLNSFPKYESHYARNKTEKKFLSSSLTLKCMYDDYCEKYCSTIPVSRWIYEKEFHEMGLQIKPFKIDTCNTCDKLAAEILYASNDESRTSKQQEQKIHHATWKLAKDVKATDIKEAKKNKEVEVICFDLQQCLPTPHLQTSVIFYKRQLWVYNLTLHICSNDRSIHNMWHEGEGERGPNQIGSALYHYILSLPDDVQHLVLWSDTCGGQNKNSIITAALQTILQHKQSLKIIDQKFLVPGHTHLECDRDHSIIEAKKKQATSIFVPRDWFNLVETANKKFSVKRLTQDNMLNFKALLKGRESPLVKRTKDTSGEIFSWKKTVWLRHSRELGDGVVAFKQSFKEEESFKFLNIRRRKTGQLVLQPSLAYNGPVPISANKKKDLLSLLYLIDPECHSFYQSLQSANQDDIDPDIRGETDEEESGGE